MNPKTGSVDTRENWLADMDGWEINEGEPTAQEQFDSLIEVVQDQSGGWVEAGSVEAW